MIRTILIFGMLLIAWTPALPETSETPPFRVGQIRVYGNEKIRTHILRREIPFRRGDLFDEEELDEARSRIQKIPGVDYSEVRAAYSPRDSSIVLSIIITEKSTFNGRPLFRRGYQNKISLGLELWELNFRGRSERLSGSFLLRGNTIVTASWENPWIGTGPRVGVGVRLTYEEYKYVYGDLGKALEDASIERLHAKLRIFRKLGSRTRITLSGGIESVRSSTPGVTLEPERDTYPTVAISFVHDSRDSPTYPWNGVYFRAKGEEVGPGSETFSIHEGTADLRLFKSLAGRGVIAGHGRLRYRDGDRMPAYRREHIGGAQTLRGYDYGSFHGTRSIVSGIEGRLPLNFSRNLPIEDVLIGIAFHAFADAAVAWEDNEDLSTRNFHGTFGAGVILLAKGASGLRFDYGWRLDDPGRFEFDIGMKF
ncbi:MAG: BamA/TamA family outer membrane protein [Candidatus Latescibacteria bacterium]|nr:BamA/TamA family outer membrane protein [Candidatus Latescibacterota bacterium]NIM22062.1 BamA/TamA family outer membrane protein [Candidatus Latescibacterota bacterium]NIM66081.1 BamA/TamA family outer membrane protein [Candidatus Latescibacterota bacterium]NIO02489.1 BamA/TamA family outer membrane protein [Candidatus Latescibacterota bacterium]NIO29400.1 BamA/TamA family outer membrane protein [Candidatus Latescibacterota bacterium]